jgi:predicted nucleic acid-binding protein
VADVIVLDASVLIGYLDGADSHHEAAQALLTRVVDDDLGAYPLTLAEVLVVPARTGRLDAVLSVLRDIDVQALPFPTDTAVRLAELRADTGLKMPDCCVLLSAEEAGADIASFDARLAQAAETRSVPVLRS